jgi:ABC-2 type transport system permease protein/sodium transport system permease protein
MMDASGRLESNPISTPFIPFSWRQQGEFILKELRETLRDRRTIITLLAMPLLLYPLLGLGFRFLAVQQLAATDPKIYVGLETERDATWVKAMMLQSSTMRQVGKKEPADSAISNDFASQVSEREIVLSLPRGSEANDLNKLISANVIDLGLRIRQTDPSRPPGVDNPTQVELVYDNTLLRGQTAEKYLAGRLDMANQALLKRWSQDLGIKFAMPIQQRQVQVKGTDRGPSILGLLPLVLLLMTVTGGVYPSIDLTAGERERNTLETLMALPVPKIRLLIAKFVAVVSVTMLTGLMNLVAMSVTLYSLQLDTVLLGERGFSVSLAVKLFLILSTFAMFYSAVLLMLSSAARSFKEAQAYLIPLLLLSIGPGLVILLPGWSLGQGTAVVPLVNVLLLSKEVLEGTAPWFPAMVTILTTIFYGFAALSLAAQIFGTDAVAVGSRSRWKDLLHRPVETRAVPSLALGLVGLALMFPSYFVASGLFSRAADVSPSARIALSGVLTAILFLGLPVLLLIRQNVALQSTFALKRPNLSALIGALLIGLSAWPIVYELVLLGQQLGWGWLDLSRFEQVQELLAGWATIPLALILLALAVVPGICEELFFRGFLFSAIRQHLPPLATICATAIAFALFHIVMAGGAAPERLLPSGLMGLILGWVRFRSNSVLPGLGLHVLHNASLLTIAHYRQELEGWGLGAQHQTHLPMEWIGSAMGILLLGLVLVALSRESSRSNSVS